MRKNEIKAGEEYGYKSYPSSEPQRVRVIEFDKPRTAYSGSRDYRGHTVRDGILVEFLDKNGETVMKTPGKYVTVPGAETILPNGIVTREPDTREWVEGEPVPSTAVVRSVQLTSTWEDAVDEMDAVAHRRAKIKRANDNHKQVAASLKELLEARGIQAWNVGPTAGHSVGQDYYFDGIKLPYTAAKLFLELLEEDSK